MSRPIRFIPDLESEEHHIFLQMWCRNEPIAGMMRYFGVQRRTILQHATRAKLPYRDRDLERQTPEPLQEKVLKKVRPDEIRGVRCTGCRGRYEANLDAEISYCPYCGTARRSAQKLQSAGGAA